MIVKSIYEQTKMEAEYTLSQCLIEEALFKADFDLAIKECRNWADVVSKKFGLSYFNNWKIFKKNLLANFYGAPPSLILFKDQCDFSALRTFIEAYKINNNIRMTIYKSDTACYSKTIILPDGEEEQMVMHALGELHATDCIAVFPESSGSNKICFRCSMTSFGQNIYFEAGYGQAFLTFEKERGLHPTAFMQKNDYKIYEMSGEKSLIIHLKKLVDKYEQYLILNGWRLCRSIGAEYIAIEGFFNYEDESKPIIVDCDLPFDKVFFYRVKNNA